MAGVPSGFNDIYNNLYNSISSKTTTVNSPTVDPSAIKSMLKQSMRPAYDKQIQSAKTAANTNRALYDSDAASRGMGTSTWLSDVKNRNANALNTNINNIESDYNTNLYSNLLSQINQQQQNKLTTDQFNASALNGARDSALSLANSRYDKWSKKRSGGGSGGGDDTKYAIASMTGPDGLKVNRIQRTYTGEDGTKKTKKIYDSSVSTVGGTRAQAHY